MSRKHEPFFFVMALILIAVVVSGFSLAGFSKPGGPLATPLFLHFHGAVFLGWFVVLAFQARLIAQGNRTLHRRLGQLSLGLAVAIVVLGYLVVSQAVAKPDMTIAGRPAVIGAVFPVFDIVNFSIAYTLGIANRANSAAHKRFMLASAILMIDPAMARLVFGLGGPGLLILPLELAFFAAMLGYDLYTQRRPHWASLSALALYGAAFAIKLNVDSLPWWKGFVEAMF